MKIGIIGAGAIGLSFAGAAAKAGFEVLISNSRGADSLASAAAALGPLVKAVSKQEAAVADVIMLSVPWKHLGAATADLPDMRGKIIIDPTNPIITPGFIIADLKGKTSSEIVAAHLPGAHVVKAFNTIPPSLIAADPQPNSGRRVVFISGDHQLAKNTVLTVLAKIGFSGIDLGGLRDGGIKQQFPGGPLASLNLVQYPL